MRNINKLTLLRYYLFLLVYYRNFYRRSFNLKIFTLDLGIYNEGLEERCVFSKLISVIFNEFFRLISFEKIGEVVSEANTVEFCHSTSENCAKTSNKHKRKTRRTRNFGRQKKKWRTYL